MKERTLLGAFEMGAIQFAVYATTEIDNPEGLLGQLSYDDAEIELLAGIPPDVEHAVLVHEMCEAANDTFDIGLTHHQIELISQAFAQALKTSSGIDL